MLNINISKKIWIISFTLLTFILLFIGVLVLSNKGRSNKLVVVQGSSYIFPGNNLILKTAGLVDTHFLDVKVLDSHGKEYPVKIKREGNFNGKIIVTPTRDFDPGIYTAVVSDLSGNEEKVKFEYGILALNFDKSVYNVGDKLYMQIATLDNNGHTICDAKLRITVEKPNGNVDIFNSTDNNIKRSDTCGSDNLTNAPDYYFYYRVSQKGLYKITVENLDVNKKVSKKIFVVDSPKFNIIRSGATRINPFKGSSDMQISITCPTTQFKGFLIEKVPLKFRIKSENKDLIIESQEDSKLLIFPLDCQKDTVFKYSYLAPKKSPELFYLGQAEVVNLEKKIVFEENNVWSLASDVVGDGLAVLSGAKTVNSSNINDTTPYPVLWSTYDYDSKYFSVSSADNTKLTLKQDGDIFVSASVPMEGTVARSAVKAEIYVNGAPYEGAIGESSYIRNTSNHTESSDDMALILTGLHANDYIQLYVNGDAAAGTVTVGTAISMTAEFISRSNAPVYNIFAATATQTTNSTDLNTNTAYPLLWTHSVVGTAYSHDNTINSQTITFNDNAVYWVTVNIPLEGAVTRANVRLKVLLNGNKVIGGEGKQGYIRNTSGHTKSSIHWSGIIKVASGDVLTVTTEKEAAAGTVTVQTGKKASMSIQKLPNNNLFVAYADQTVNGTNINPSSPSDWDWTTELIKDTALFSHSTTSNSNEITVLEDGDYLLSFNSEEQISTSGWIAASRTNNKVKVLVNGVAVNGAETKSNYIRNTSGHTESSSMLVFLLKDLKAGDKITVSTEQEAATGTVTTTDKAILMLWYKPLTVYLLEQGHFHWRNDDGDLQNATSATNGNEDTPLFDVTKGSVYRLRLEVANKGTVPSDPTQFQLEYGEKNGSCDAVTSWNSVSSGTAFDMFDSSYFTDGDDTTNISVSNGGVTDEETTFITDNNGAKDTSDLTSSLVLNRHEFVELEYSLRVTSNAKAGTTYCFRVTNNGTSIDSYQKYAEMTILSHNDFKIQRGIFVLTGSSHTLTAGVDYKAPASIDKAFIRITNTSSTGAGKNAGGGAQNADDVTVYIENPSNLLTSVNFVRASTGSNNTFVAWEIIEYTGPPNGPNEMIVRDQGTLTFGTSDLTARTATISNVNDDNDIVVWVTGVQNPDTGRSDYNTGLITSDWDGTNDQGVFSRGEAGNDAVNISWAVVEFVGEHWRIQRITHTYNSAGTVETETIPTPVNDVSRTFTYAQKSSGSGLQGLDEYGHEVWLSDVDTVSFELQSGSSTPSDQQSVVWIIENTQTNGMPMHVWRSNGALPTGTSEPHSTSINIGTTLQDISNASIFVNNRSSGSGTYFPRPIVGAYISDSSHYVLWQSDTGQTETFRTEVVEWPVSTPDLTQRDFRVYENSSNMNVSSALANQDEIAYIKLNEPFRVRFLLNVGLKDMEVNSVNLKLQVAKAVGACDTNFVGETYVDVGPGSLFNYYNNSSLSDGAYINTTSIDPVDSGVTVKAQTFEEANYIKPSQNFTSIGQDAMWDVSLIPETAVGSTRYCFRVVFADNTLLKGYDKIITVFTGPSNSQVLRHGGALDSYNKKTVLTF